MIPAAGLTRRLAAGDNKPLLAGPYAPVPPAINVNSAAGVNNIRGAGGGLRLVIFPKAGLLPDTVLVTTAGAGGRFCNLLTRWATTASPGSVLVRDVGCYTPTGIPGRTVSLITYASAH